ncbi:MAG: hypothetical protein ACI4T5_02725, partial [Prevotella sp.]
LLNDTPILYFCDFTVTSATNRLIYLYYNMLSGGRRGDRRVTEVTVKGIFLLKNSHFFINLCHFPTKNKSKQAKKSAIT